MKKLTTILFAVILLSNLAKAQTTYYSLDEAKAAKKSGKKVETLDLSEAKWGWAYIPKDVNEFSLTLETLDMSKNKITKYPEWAGDLYRLRYLYLQNNRISELAEQFGWLDKVQKVNLSNNKLTKFPKSMKHMARLEYLYLDGNPVDANSLIKAVKSLNRLNFLSLKDTGLSAKSKTKIKASLPNVSQIVFE